MRCSRRSRASWPMRPRELTLRGFRSYADETTFDFGDRSLVGIVGPIGSGKSSILDAVAFALYGKTPRIASDTKSLINQRRDALGVSLTFEVDGALWRVVRSLRRKGASAHTLYTLEGDEFKEVADKERDVNAQVEAILGMDFEAFRRSVLLAQNQFAGFLEATATDRNKVLKGVFGFERLDAMRDAVKARIDRLGGRLQVLAERRASAEADRVLLVSRQVELIAAEERAATLAALRLSVNQAQDVIREAEGRLKAAAAEAAILDSLADQVPTQEATAGLFAEADAATAVMAEAEAAAIRTEASAVRAAEAWEGALAAVGGRSALERAADVVASVRGALTDRDRERARLDEVESLLTAAESDVADAAEAVRLAEQEARRGGEAVVAAAEAEQTARDSLHRAHQAERVSLLRSGLTVGEPCPVCDQMVATLPPARSAPVLDAAQDGLTEAVAKTAALREAEGLAKARLAESKAAAAAAAKRVKDAAAMVSRSSKALAEAEAATDAQSKAAAAILGDGDPAQRLAEARASVSAAEENEREAQAAAAKCRSEVEAARARLDTVAKGLSALRRDLANLAGRLGVEEVTGDDPAGIEGALRGLRGEWIRRRASAQEKREHAERELEAATAARADLLGGAGLSASDDIVEVATEAAKEATGIAAEVRLAEKRLAELESLAGEEKELVAASSLLERLNLDLRPSGFLEFVLDERRRSLADLAGVHFETLSAGRYRFSDDADFNLVDLNAADLVRAPASLSGGETFLASLSLALALAEIVAREGGRLDAFFLDEGFGSLDPEHLDLAMDGIERLVAGNTERVVVVVSHVQEMRDRVEDLIVLDRDELGSTRVVRGAAKS